MQKQLVVSLEKNRFMGLGSLDQPVEHAVGVRPTINVITQKNLDRPTNGIRDEVVIYPREQPVQQIRTPVHVTDGIDRYALGNAKCRFSPLVRKSQLDHPICADSIYLDNYKAN